MKMHAWNRGIEVEAEGSTMPRRRMQFTLGWLMILVAVCGFEAFRYTRSAKRAAAMNLAVTITDNIYGYIFGVVLFWVVFWAVSSRLRAANSVATNRGDQEPESGRTDA
jgi:hypothetical protein